jgi:pimeloyl-ACP methyl ester carboxylesterase
VLTAAPRSWNFQGQNVSEEQYSYVYNAAARGASPCRKAALQSLTSGLTGISTFRYDRIGTGSSEAPSDVFNVAQAATEVGILEAVAEKLKNSTEIGGRAWNRTLLVGHSYGSAQSQALSVARPELVDGIILQGFSANATGLPFYLAATVYTEASQVFPRALARLPPGWLVTATPASNQLPFVWAPTADASAVALARNTEQAVTQGSLFSIGSIGGPSNFTGPVAVVLGDKDFIFALNDIQGPNGTNKAQAAASMLYAQSSNATGIVLPDVGHAVNIHRGAQQAYTQMLDFAAVNGLA